MKLGDLQTKLIWTSDTCINHAMSHAVNIFCGEVLLGWYCSIAQHEFSEKMHFNDQLLEKDNTVIFLTSSGTHQHNQIHFLGSPAYICTGRILGCWDTLHGGCTCVYLSHIHLHLGEDTNTSAKTVLRPKAPDSLFVPPISFQVCKQLMLDQDSAVTIRGRRIHTRRQCLVSAPNAQMLVHAFTENSEHPSKDKLNAVISWLRTGFKP